MKKRILSMLLLVAMVVTALPLMALTVLATGTPAEEPTFTENDYNGLYVQDGLFFAADFFKTKGGALSDYIWTEKVGSPSLSATNGTVADGKLSIAAGVLTVKPGGTMKATDYDLTAEYAMEVRSFASTSLSDNMLKIRGASLRSGKFTNPNESTGLPFSFSFSQVRSHQSGDYATWQFINQAYEGNFASFTRHLLASQSALNVNFLKGADTMSVVFALSGQVALTKAEMEAIKADPNATPALAIYTRGNEIPAKHVVNDTPTYWNQEHVVGYRVYRKTDNSNNHEWLSETFQHYFAGVGSAVKQSTIMALTMDDLYYVDNNTLTEEEKGDRYAIYSTQAAAEAAKAEAPKNNATESYTYKVTGADAAWQIVETTRLFATGAKTEKTLETVYESEAAATEAMAALPADSGDATKTYTYSTDKFYLVSQDTTPYGIAPNQVNTAWTDTIGTGNAFTGDVYAIRYYDRALSEAEILQNRVADLAKYFGLNIAAYRLLNEESKAAVAEDMATYQLTSAPEAVAAAFAEAVAEAAAAQYEVVVDVDLTAVMLKYGLDPYLAIVMPRDVAVNTTAFLAELVKSETFDESLGATVGAAFEKALELDAAAYAALSEADEGVYDALYVKDGLHTSFDFFKLNEYWNSDVTLPVAPALTEAYDEVSERLTMKYNVVMFREGDETKNYFYTLKKGIVTVTAGENGPVATVTATPTAFGDVWVHSSSTTGYAVFATEAEAEAALEALEAYVAEDPTARAVLLPETSTHPYGNFSGSQPVDYGVYYHPALNSTYNNAVNASADGYKVQVNNALAKFRTFGSATLTATLPAVSGICSHDHDGSIQRVATTLGDGYLQMDFFSGQSYLSVNNLPAGKTLTAEYVMTGGENNVGSDHGQFYTFSDFALIKQAGTVGVNSITFGGSTSYGNLSKLAFSFNMPASPQTAMTFTTTVDRSKVAATAAAVNVSLYVDGEQKLKPTATWDSSAQTHITFFGYGTSAESRIYAIRYYEGTLSTEQMARNHMADVLKFFRLNVPYLNLKDTAVMESLAIAVKDISLSDSTRAEAQAAILSLIGEAAATYYAKYKTALGTDFDVFKAYHLDPKAYVTMSAGNMIQTRTLLKTLAAQGTFDPALGKTASKAYEALLLADAAGYATVGGESTDFYDELYVQDGYVFGIDFFTLNRPEVWGDAAPTVPFKDVDLSGVTIAEGYDEKTTTGDNNAGLKSAIDKFKENHNAFVDQFITEKDLSTLNFAHYMASSTSYSGAKAVYTPSTGSILFHKNAAGTNGIQPYYFSNAAVVSDNVSFQLVMAPNEGLDSAFFFFYNNRPSLAADADGNYKITGLTHGFTKKEHTSYASIPNTSDAQMLTFTLENVKTDKTNVTYTVRLWDQLLSKTTGSCGNPDNNTYLGWGSSAAMNLYALRVYNAELDATEIARNHFADVAKYFRLNLAGMDTENAEQMADLYEAVADVSLTSSTRGEAQLAVMTVLAEDAKAALSAPYADLKATHADKAEFIDLAAKYLVPVETLENVLTSGRAMDAIYAAVTDAALFGTGDVVAAHAFFREQFDLAYDYYSYKSFEPDNDAWDQYLRTLASKGLAIEAMMALPRAERLAIAEAAPATQEDLNAAVDTAMAKYVAYAKEKAEKYEADDYNALYVRDGLFFAADFFRSNEHWSNTVVSVNANGSMLSYAWKYDDGKTGGSKSSLTTTSATTIRDGKLVLDGQKLAITPGGTMKATDYDVSSERVMEYKGAADARSLELRNFFFNISSTSQQSYSEETGLTLKFANLSYNSAKTWGSWGTSRSWQSFYAAVKDFGNTTNPTDFVIAPGVQNLSIVFAFDGMIALSEAERDAKIGNVEAPAIAIYSTVGEDLIVEVPDGEIYAKEELLDKWRVIRWKTNGGAENSTATVLGIYDTEDAAKEAMATFQSTQADAKDYTYKVNQHYRMEDDTTPYGVPAEFIRASGWTDPIYGTGDVYAIRYYDRAITKAETLQNHFADLAKFYRLDIGNYLAMTADEKTALHEAMQTVLIGDGREDVVEAYYAACGAQYAALTVTGDAATDAALRVFAATVDLDVSRLAKLSANKALAEKVLALADTAYATNGDVVNYRLDQEVLDFWEVNESKGVSVRVDNAYSDKQAGVRAEYAIGVDLIKTMIDKYGVDGAITFGTKIMMNGNEAAILSFTATKDNAAENGLAIVGTNTVVKTGAVTAANTKVVGGQLTYTYTVNYTDAQLTQVNLLDLEYSFVRFVEIHGEEFVIDHGNKEFGDRVSLREAYSHFAGDYATDSVVTKVMEALAANPKQ